MRIGSYLRFFVGLLLSIEIIKQVVTGKEVSSLALSLSVIYIVLSVLFFTVRF